MWILAITLCIGGTAWIHHRNYWQLYRKTTGNAIPESVTKKSIGLLALTGCAIVCAILAPNPLALSTWFTCSLGITALIVPECALLEVLHAESSRHISRRLSLLKSQLDRLEERNRLDSVLKRVVHSESALGKITERFELILATIENHLAIGDHSHAERIITVFARHLRQTLYEGSMPFLPLSESIEHIETHFDLMHLLTGKRLSCGIDDGMLDNRTRSRHTATFLVSDWAQCTLWPYFQMAERSLESLGDSVLTMDIIGDELIIDYTPPHSMRLRKGTRIQPLKRFKLLGDSKAYPSVTPSSKEEELYS